MPTLDWLNRAEALTSSDKVPYRVLEPVSVHGDGNTDNLLIQGDNLDALKALLPFYRGRVKCMSNSAQYFPLISVQFFPLCQPFELDLFDA